VLELLPQGRTVKKPSPKPMTDAQRKRSVSFFIGTTLLIAAAICLGVGIFAWRVPPPQPVKVTASVLTTLPSTSIFDSGVTLFAAVPDHRNPPAPLALGCSLSAAGGPSTDALIRPVPELVGSRVVDGTALTGVVDLRHPADGAQVLCDGPAAKASSSLWVLPSDEGAADQPLAIIVTALFLFGLGALVHPRTRSI
jgi:ABC-type proline/glycine betaine transport system permease subunit